MHIFDINLMRAPLNYNDGRYVYAECDAFIPSADINCIFIFSPMANWRISRYVLVHIYKFNQNNMSE